MYGVVSERTRDTKAPLGRVARSERKQYMLYRMYRRDKTGKHLSFYRLASGMDDDAGGAGSRRTDDGLK